MRRCLASIVMVVTCALGCDTSPAAPTIGFPPRPPSPLAGIYTLTIEVDDKCTIPAPLKVRTYVVELRDTQGEYLAVKMVDEEFGDLGGDLSGRTLDYLRRFNWNNVDMLVCGYPDKTGSNPLYICGDGSASASGDGTISGVLLGNAFLEGGAACVNATHRYVLQRRS